MFFELKCIKIESIDWPIKWIQSQWAHAVVPVKHKKEVWMCVEGLEVRELFKTLPNNFQNVLLYVLFIKDFCLTLMKCWHPQI